MIGNIDILVKELCKLPKEVDWVEFKHNNCQPMMVAWHPFGRCTSYNRQSSEISK